MMFSSGGFRWLGHQLSHRDYLEESITKATCESSPTSVFDSIKTSSRHIIIALVTDRWHHQLTILTKKKTNNRKSENLSIFLARTVGEVLRVNLARRQREESDDLRFHHSMTMSLFWFLFYFSPIQSHKKQNFQVNENFKTTQNRIQLKKFSRCIIYAHYASHASNFNGAIRLHHEAASTQCGGISCANRLRWVTDWAEFDSKTFSNFS